MDERKGNKIIQGRQPPQTRVTAAPQMQTATADKAALAQEQKQAQATPRIGPEQLQTLSATLRDWDSALRGTKHRIINAENWWKLHNINEEDKQKEVEDKSFRSASGWLHNVISAKHADAMEAYPEPLILPREEGDKAEAKILSSIVPCIFEQNSFEKTYSDAMWQKCKTGTGVYKIVWDSGKLNGLGDIAIERVNLLSLYWEPGVADIQKGKYFFHVEWIDKEDALQAYPQLQGHVGSGAFIEVKFSYDDRVRTDNKLAKIDVYYHLKVGEKTTLQYIQYINDVVLYASEDDPKMRESGFYAHGKYPYVFDALFPIEGSPCGYGYVDLCKNPQTEIDLLKSAMVKNAMSGATPRYMMRKDGQINEDEFLDLTRPLVHSNGNIDEDSFRQIVFSPMDGVYVNFLDRTIQELRETSGNTETSTGNISSGVTAASAIAALQEASGKGSRDSNLAAYRAYSELVSMTIENIRQFYDAPRQFRIVGQYGMEQYISYSNAKLQPQQQGIAFGVDLGMRLPVFDIKISAQKRNAYTKMAMNELALQFFGLGFFNPQLTDQVLATLEMMDFDGIDALKQRVAQNGTMYQKLVQYMQLALMFAQSARPDMVQGLSADIQQTLGAGAGQITGGAVGSKLSEAEGETASGDEHPRVEKAREKSANSAQPQ